MILLLLTTLAFASDVYEMCIVENQIWSDQNQTFYSKSVATFFSFQTIQFIIHKNTFEVNRKVRNIASRETIGGLPCFREHENSFICFDADRDQFLWEFHHRNGKVTRDIYTVCVKNGE